MTTAGILAQQATTHSGTLAVPLLPSENEFFQHFLVFDQQIAQADLLDNSNIIYPPTVSWSFSIRPNLFNNAGVIYAPYLMFNQTLTQSVRFTNAQVFYAPRVYRGALVPDLFTNVQIFYPPNIVTVHLRPELFTNVPEFYSPTVSGLSGWNLLPDDVFTNVSEFYAPSVAYAAQTLTPDDVFTNDSIFYGPTVTVQVFTRMVAQTKTMTPVQVTRTAPTNPEP